MKMKIQYSHPEVDGADYDTSVTTREAFATALAVLSGEEVSESAKIAARKGLRVFLAQRGCEHLEGRAGLAETCDVFIFG
jgi:hypothetical protein